MKTIAAAALVIMLAVSPASASNHDRPGPNDISMDQAREIATKEGYSKIRAVEFDDGQWEVDAVDANGREVEIEIDAASGKVVRVKKD